LEEEINPDSAFINKLDSIIIKKEANLPLIYWNATFASPEFQKLFSLAGGSLSPSITKSEIQPIYEALLYLAEIGPSIGKEMEAVDILEMERNLHQLQKESIGGNLLRSIEQLTFYLEQVTEQLEKFREKHQETISEAQRTNLYRIFQNNYRKEIHPYLSATHQTGERIFYAVEQLYQQQPLKMSAVFTLYFQRQLSLDNPDGLWQQFQETIRRHNTAWQEIVDSYNILVFK